MFWLDVLCDYVIAWRRCTQKCSALSVYNLVVSRHEPGNYVINAKPHVPITRHLLRNLAK